MLCCITVTLRVFWGSHMVVRFAVVTFVCVGVCVRACVRARARARACVRACVRVCVCVCVCVLYYITRTIYDARNHPPNRSTPPHWGLLPSLPPFYPRGHFHLSHVIPPWQTFSHTPHQMSVGISGQSVSRKADGSHCSCCCRRGHNTAGTNSHCPGGPWCGRCPWFTTRLCAHRRSSQRLRGARAELKLGQRPGRRELYPNIRCLFPRT